MSLFGGLDMGGAAVRQERTLRRDFELRRSGWDRKGYHYHGGADLCLQHGRFRPGRALPLDFGALHGLDGTTCFLNALLACEHDPRLTYCEGYVSLGRQANILHAWCIAPDDGVCEVTYPTGGVGPTYTVGLPTLPVLPPDTWGYWGVTFRTELIREHVDTFHEAGSLDRSGAEVRECITNGWTPDMIHHEHGYPLLKLPYRPERTHL